MQDQMKKQWAAREREYWKDKTHETPLTKGRSSLAFFTKTGRYLEGKYDTPKHLREELKTARGALRSALYKKQTAKAQLLESEVKSIEKYLQNAIRVQKYLTKRT
jgi:hypothetical protein